MKTRAVRIYGKEDLRLEEFELPEMGENEILARVVSDSICMSSYKAAEQGGAHKRVPEDCAVNPTIIGHEFCGEVLEVGSKWKEQYKPGDKFSIQPALAHKLEAAGYSYKYVGGDATYVILPDEYISAGNILKFGGESFYEGSLAEPLSCVIGTCHAMYHTEYGNYEHKMGIVEGGKMAVLAAAGPMGLAAVDYIIHGDRRPGLLVVTDIADDRLKRAAEIQTVEDAKKHGVELIYLNTATCGDPVEKLREISGGEGYNDIIVFAPVAAVVEQADAVLAFDGCLNFFSGPADTSFSAKLNFYNVHYSFTHIVGTSGGNTDDMREALAMTEQGRLNPAGLVTHVGGLNCVIDTTLNLPSIKGGKKLIYTGAELPLTAIADFDKQDDERFKELSKIVAKNNGLWCGEAEKYLLAHFA